MENSALNHFEEQLFDLLERKEYADLTTREKELVKRQISEEEYTNRRNILLQSKTAFADDLIPAPKPLAIYSNKLLVSYQRQLTTHRFLLAIAAMIIVFLLVWPAISGSKNIPSEKVLVEHDTITIEKEIHDTIILEKTNPVYITKNVYTSAPTIVNCEREELRLLETGPVNPILINQGQTENKGHSLQKDRTSVLLQDVSFVSEFVGQ